MKKPSEPVGAGKTSRIVLMPRDPEWLFAYWELEPGRQAELLEALSTERKRARTILRVHDVTAQAEAGAGEPALEESADYEVIEVAPSADHWYIKVGRPDRRYCVEYVVVAPDGRAVSLAASGVVAAPPDCISEDRSETWVAPDAEEPATPPVGPREDKWLEGQDHRQAAGSSPGVADASEEPPPPQSPR
jgi:hypothetical protein